LKRGTARRINRRPPCSADVQLARAKAARPADRPGRQVAGSPYSSVGIGAPTGFRLRARPELAAIDEMTGERLRCRM